MMFPKFQYQILLKISSFLFIVLFVYTAVSKLLEYETFTLQLAQSPLLSAFAEFIAVVVPGFELLIATLLFFPKYRMFGLYASLLLMIMFTTYIFIILNFSDFIPCSCGGVLESLSWNAHLLFNGFFIFLALTIILMRNNIKLKYRAYIPLLLIVIGIGSVSLLYAFSERKMHRNNAFQRRYVPHPIEKIGEYDLEYNSFYIAGVDDTIIYLGNATAPLYLKTVNIASKVISEVSITLSQTDLPYRNVRTSIKPPHFFVGDGTVPILFRGSLKNRFASPLMYNQAYFTKFAVADSAHVGVVAFSSATKTTSLGLIKDENNGSSFHLYPEVVSSKGDGIFDADGMLLWNEKQQRFIYLYYYRNSYEISDKKLKHLSTGKTIDTISEPILEIANFKRKNELKIGGKAVIVNISGSTSGNLLYIQSNRLGKYDDEKLIKKAGIIDVYDVTGNTYEFSFYLYHEPRKKITEFHVHNDFLIALVENKLLIYTLKPEFFNSDLN